MSDGYTAPPMVEVIRILSKGAQDESLSELDRGMCKSWLDRLVDDQGNPLDDLGRTVPLVVVDSNRGDKRGTLWLAERLTATLDETFHTVTPMGEGEPPKVIAFATIDPENAAWFYEAAIERGIVTR